MSLLWSLALPTHTQLVPCASPMDDSTGLSERSTLAMHRSVARWLLRMLCSDVFKACTLTDSKSAESAKSACAIVADDKPAPGSVVWVCSAWDTIAMVCDVYAKFKSSFAAKTTKLHKLAPTTKCCIATLGVLTRCVLSLCQCGAPSRCLCSPGACRSAGHQCPRSSSRAGCVPLLQSSSMHACTWDKTSAELGETSRACAKGFLCMATYASRLLRLPSRKSVLFGFVLRVPGGSAGSLCLLPVALEVRRTCSARFVVL